MVNDEWKGMGKKGEAIRVVVDMSSKWSLFATG